MTYRVYSGPPGTESISPMEKEKQLYKELNSLDDAVGWARHVSDTGRVALLIEGDDGTRMDKEAIAVAIRQPQAVGNKAAQR